MILISDIGNTNITAGLFDKGEKVDTWRINTDTGITSEDYSIILSDLISNKIYIEGTIVSSVVPDLTEIYMNALKKCFKIEPIEFSYKIDTGIKIITDKKSEVGADRIVNATAVSALYKTPAIVVDLGTATTFDIINDKKEFIGGIIAPGMKIQTKALAKYTSKLPQTEVDEAKSVIGRNTKEAILSGVVRGHACMIEGLLKECEKELNTKFTTVATGGYANLISKYLNTPFDYIDEDLTLKGLNIIYNLIKS